MNGLAWSCRRRVCPPISHPRSWLCSVPWHACVHVRWVISKELTVRVSHPNLVCALLIHELRVVVFLSLRLLSLFFGKQTAKCKQNVRITVKWLPIVALQKFACRKCDCFLPLLSCQIIGFLEFLANLTPIIVMEERTKTIQHIN